MLTKNDLAAIKNSVHVGDDHVLLGVAEGCLNVLAEGAPNPYTTRNPNSTRAQLIMNIANHSRVLVVYQKRPWTTVVIKVLVGKGVGVTYFGSSKVCYPDQWDSTKGIWLALNRCIGHVASIVASSRREEAKNA